MALKPSKIVCVGRNYAKHAAEMGNDVPSEPLVFLKPPSAIIEDGEPIVLPPGAGRVDYEGEIGVVIGRTARSISRSDAWGHVASIVAVNDVTARDYQKSDDQWARAKGFDTFCPVGTPVPVGDVDVSTLTVTTRVNGELRQEGAVSEMAYDIPTILEFITTFMTLHPGDLVLTGTPDGIAPLQPGDEVVVEVSGAGAVRNPVVAG